MEDSVILGVLKFNKKDKYNFTSRIESLALYVPVIRAIRPSHGCVCVIRNEPIKSSVCGEPYLWPTGSSDVTTATIEVT